MIEIDGKRKTIISFISSAVDLMCYHWMNKCKWKKEGKKDFLIYRIFYRILSSK